jgi:hypothetical protein
MGSSLLSSPLPAVLCSTALPSSLLYNYFAAGGCEVRIMLDKEKLLKLLEICKAVPPDFSKLKSNIEKLQAQDSELVRANGATVTLLRELIDSL